MTAELVDIEDEPVQSSAFSDAVAKILRHSSGPKPRQIKKENDTEPAQNDSEVKAEPDSVQSGIKGILKKSKKPSLQEKSLAPKEKEPWHVKPQVTEREKERRLNKIATKGVVQLFNAVRQQQSALEEKLEEAGPSMRKSEKVLKTVSKGAFLDMLKGTKRSAETGQASQDGGEKRWKVINDDFLLKEGAEDEDDSDDGDRGSDNEEMEEIL